MIEEISDLLSSILVPLGVCVVLPLGIVWITGKAINRRKDNITNLLMKAIENNQLEASQSLIETLSIPKRTSKELLNLRLLRALIFLFGGIALLLSSFLIPNIDDESYALLLTLALLSIAVGLSYLIVFFVSRNRKEE